MGPRRVRKPDRVFHYLSVHIDIIHVHAHRSKIPDRSNAIDLIEDDNYLYCGRAGNMGDRPGNWAIQNADLIIAVGTRISIRQVGYNWQTWARAAEVIMVDIDQYELSRNIKPDERKYHTDARDFMRMLLDEDVPGYSEWRQQCLDAKKYLSPYDIQPGNLAVMKIASLLPPNPIVSVDVGMNQCWSAQSLVLKGYGGRIHISGGYGTMGC